MVEQRAKGCFLMGRKWFSMLVLSFILGTCTYGAPCNRLSVVTYNTWLLDFSWRFGGLQHVLPHTKAKDLVERLRAMPAALASLDADVLCLQEVWIEYARTYLLEELKKHGYVYSAYTSVKNGSLAWNGLMILSRKQLAVNEGLSASTLSYRYATGTAENIVSKGAIFAQVQVDDQWVNIYNTHLGAVDFDETKRDFDEKQVHLQVVQALELKKWIQQNNKNFPARASVLAGDFNAHYEEQDFWAKDAENVFLRHGKGLGVKTGLYSLMTNLPIDGGLGFQDSGDSQDVGFDRLKFKTSDDLVAESSFDPTTNYYAASGYHSNAPSQCVDYIFYCGDLSVQYHRRVLDASPFLSDHFGMMAGFLLEESPEKSQCALIRARVPRGVSPPNKGVCTML
jgi:endonuclease/exonuclease/phosphatase family metal-dependent hydrolase